MSSFYICGGILAGWALLVSVLGITRERFPATPGAERIVGVISIVLVVAAVASGIIASANEAEEEEEGGEESAALILAR